MENAHSTTIVAAHGHGEPDFDTRAIWRTFRILLYITLVELALAIAYYEIHFSNPHLVKHLLNGVFIILTLTKAFYIIAEFMHLRHEIKNMILTIAVPALLFIWFITAFLWDGNSFKELRNRYNPQQEQKAPAPKNEAAKPGTME